MRRAVRSPRRARGGWLLASLLLAGFGMLLYLGVLAPTPTEAERLAAPTLAAVRTAATASTPQAPIQRLEPPDAGQPAPARDAEAPDAVSLATRTLAQLRAEYGREREFLTAYLRVGRANPASLLAEAESVLPVEASLPEKLALLRALDQLDGAAARRWLLDSLRAPLLTAPEKEDSLADFALRTLAARAERDREARAALRRALWPAVDEPGAVLTPERRWRTAGILGRLLDEEERAELAPLLAAELDPIVRKAFAAAAEREDAGEEAVDARSEDPAS